MTMKYFLSDDGAVVDEPLLEESNMENDDRIDKQDVPILIAVFTYLSYALLYIMGHFRDFLIRINVIREYSPSDPKTKNFVPLIMNFESFYTRNLYRRMMDCWNRPILTNPGVCITVVDRSRVSMFDNLDDCGNRINCINLGSYNYLGFGDNAQLCSSFIKNALHKYGISSCSAYNEFGMLAINRELEKTVANYVGKEDAICFPMGFATNSSNIQVFLDEDCCIVSDELNHASLVLGSRLSSCKIFIYKHNDMTDLESILRDIIVQRRGRAHMNWKKIILIIEGIYSMEGTFVNLPSILDLKKKYKFYIYLDEAHSIGCSGATGRGVTELFNIDPVNIDIMMGTFTKSFAACGGYIAADKKIIDLIRRKSLCAFDGVTIPPVVCAQIISTIKIMSGEIGGDLGRQKLIKLKKNAAYFRSRLKDLGFIIYGHEESPIVPLLIYIPGKICQFSRMMLERNIGIVVVGFPATPILLSRARFCLSSNHTEEMLDKVLEAIDEVGTKIGLKYNRYMLG